MKILGVDLGSYSIKIAELETSGKGYSFNAFHEFPLSQDPNRDRGLEIIEILRNFSSQYDATARWIVGVPQTEAATHLKRFPFRERQKILKSLPFELEDDIPMDIDEVIFDAKVSEYVGPMADVLTVAVPKESVEETLGVAKDGGFDADLISVEGLAFANLFERWQNTPVETPLAMREVDEATGQLPASTSRLVLHMGHSRTLLLVYRDTGLVAVRSIQWGGIDVAQALVGAFNIPMHEAIKTLHSKAYILMNSAGASKDQMRLSQAVATSVDHLMRDLRLTLIEVKAAYNLEFSRIDMTGGMSSIQNLGAYITQSLEIPANLAPSIFSEVSTRFALTSEVESVGGVALGLAIEGLKRPRNPAINLRQGEFARENLSLKLFWENWRVPVQIAIAAFMIFTVYSFVRESMSAGLMMTADEQLTESAQKVLAQKNIADATSSITRYLSTQKSLIRSREAYAQIDDYVPAFDVLAKLSEKLPVLTKPVSGQGLDVTVLTIENDDGHIEGFVQGSVTIPQVERALEDVVRAKSVVKSPGSNSVAGKGTPFSYNFKLNRKL